MYKQFYHQVNYFIPPLCIYCWILMSVNIMRYYKTFSYTLTKQFFWKFILSREIHLFNFLHILLCRNSITIYSTTLTIIKLFKASRLNTLLMEVSDWQLNENLLRNIFNRCFVFCHIFFLFIWMKMRTPVSTDYSALASTIM